MTAGCLKKPLMFAAWSLISLSLTSLPPSLLPLPLPLHPLPIPITIWTATSHCPGHMNGQLVTLGAPKESKLPLCKGIPHPPNPLANSYKSHLLVWVADRIGCQGRTLGANKNLVEESQTVCRPDRNGWPTDKGDTLTWPGGRGKVESWPLAGLSRVVGLTQTPSGHAYEYWPPAGLSPALAVVVQTTCTFAMLLM